MPKRKPGVKKEKQLCSRAWTASWPSPCFPKLNAMLMELLLTMKGVEVYIAEDGRPGGH